MSEEKLYAVKNDEGKYWDFSDNDIFWSLDATRCPTTNNELAAKDVVDGYGGHVVILTEEPKKVVLNNEQAKIVEKARASDFPTSYISSRLLLEAYVNGYTLAKEKKYNVKVPHTKEFWYYRSFGAGLLANSSENKKLRGKFTEAEIDHYGLQDCEKEEVTDDEQ